MLPLELLSVTLASLVVRANCSNDFVTDSFPSEFALGNKTEFHWEDLEGYIAGIFLHVKGEDEDEDEDPNWILEPDCSDDDSDSSCTAYANNGSAYFNGSFANGTEAAVGSGYELRLLWTDSEDYDDIDDDTSEVSSPSFSIVQGTPEEAHASGVSTGEKAGIAVAVVVVTVIMVVVLWWRLRKERRQRWRRSRRKADRDAEKENGEERWSTTAADGLGKSEGPWTSWADAGAAALPTKPSPTAGRGRRSGSGGSGGTGDSGRGQLYLDNKAELPAEASNNHQHKLSLRGTTTPPSNKRTLPKRAASAPMAPVELPAEPMREQAPALRPGTKATTFVYNPRPSYGLQTSPAPDPGPDLPTSPVSPVSPAAVGPVDGSVSPVSPISRKPVGGSAEAAPAGQWQGRGSEIKIIVTDTAQVAHDGGRL